MWVLGTKPTFSARAASVLNHRAISPVPIPKSFKSWIWDSVTDFPQEACDVRKAQMINDRHQCGKRICRRGRPASWCLGTLELTGQVQGCTREEAIPCCGNGWVISRGQRRAVSHVPQKSTVPICSHSTLPQEESSLDGGL